MMVNGKNFLFMLLSSYLHHIVYKNNVNRFFVHRRRDGAECFIVFLMAFDFFNLNNLFLLSIISVTESLHRFSKNA
ncbi:MAG: hypothetical protein A3B74_00005 [Candidatus Kerfeldbacteria bacterium RIFCSPHIGHO2_02_FULL_42_14]|uniref:Uncharacterized protein n=1 Tax=Candidatus Kerfeldbacteria bacterium RIFCSPHIGHO2_02_FULL_42_14 TaxID=1798540 RepID=A0A1G2ARF1_9BACT|nr:MAG: hypothetical protein A3B74_00005 [Candidatus Kerfeldbacteria bacterium RIFCSPHIGHO2_02_FULL_42_14]